VIKTCTWICPHGYEHNVVIVASPTTGHGERISPGRVSIKAPRVCPWCVVDHRAPLKT
jgi:hypothetical protein